MRRKTVRYEIEFRYVGERTWRLYTCSVGAREWYVRIGRGNVRRAKRILALYRGDSHEKRFRLVKITEIRRVVSE